MAVGDVVLTNKGVFNISGQALLTAANTINLGAKQLSGQQMFLIPAGEGQINLMKMVVTGW